MRLHTTIRRTLAAVLSLGMAVSMCSGTGAFSTIAYADQNGAARMAEPTQNLYERVADPDTTDNYQDKLLNDKNGSRYAGRVWTDKSVFAFGEENGSFSKENDNSYSMTLDMATDGYNSSVGLKSDFLHVYSALASSQVVNEYPPSPIDMVLVLDVSSSMGDETEPAEGTVWKDIYNDLVNYFKSPEGQGILEAENFKGYFEANKGKYTSIEDAAAKRTFKHTRFLNLIYSANNVIEQLMNNNSQNRISVVVYDRRATVIMPLAHYLPNDNTLPLTVKPGSKSDAPDKDYVYDTKYLNEGNDAAGIIHSHLQNMKFKYLSPFFDGHDMDDKEDKEKNGGYSDNPTEYVDVDVMRVVAAPIDTDVTTIDVANLRLSGTNTHAGLTAGLEQLANAKDTTLTATLSNGQVTTVPRIPAVVVMTDGGSNTVANGPWYDPDYDLPVQRSDNKNEWSSVVVTQYLLTAAYLKSAVEKNYADYMALGDEQDLPVYTVGVDLRDDSDEWVPARLYPMMDPANFFKEKEEVPLYADNPSAAKGEIPLAAEESDYEKELARDNASLIGSAYDNVYTWLEKNAEGKEGESVTNDFPVIHWSGDDTNGKFKGRFQQGESDKMYIIPFELDDVNATDKGTDEGILEYKNGYDGSEEKIESIPQEYNLLWHGWNDAKDLKAEPSWGDKNSLSPLDVDDDFFGTATFWPFSEAQKVGESLLDSEDDFSAAIYTQERSVSYQDEVDETGGATGDDKSRMVEAVTVDDIRSNINYVTTFYNVSSANLDSIFGQILAEVLGQVFVPVSGDNDAGVGDALTYQDPIGQYMEVKHGAIEATPHHQDDSDPRQKETYDMAMLLFGEMHGVVRTGVYDFQWNDEWMKAHNPGGQSKVAMDMGWYKGDPENATEENGNFLPADTDPTKTSERSAEGLWDAGWVFRVNFETLKSYVPIVGDPKTPEDLSQQAKNTVYTLYRFACNSSERNALHRNPVYGAVPTELENEWNALETKPADNSFYSDVPGVYRLSDIRIWVEHTGDYVDTQGAITPEKAGYDDSLYVNLPTAAIPTQLAEITLGPDGVLAYETNLGIDHYAEEGAKGYKEYCEYCAQSTPFRLFYAVGLEDSMILRDSKGDQTGVNIAALPQEYIDSHTENGRVYFYSNYYSGTRYTGYVGDTSSYRTMGDPTATFSPSADNRYYIYQKPLPLVKHVFRAINDPGVYSEYGLQAVDNGKWDGSNVNKSNSETIWENGEKGGANWSGGNYMGTYESQDAYKQAAEDALKPESVGTDGKHYITDMNGEKFEYVTGDKEGGIVCIKQSFLTEDNVGGTSDEIASGTSNGFNKDDYYFVIIEYYMPTSGVGHDINGEDIDGSTGGEAIKLIVARTGSYFASNVSAENIKEGDMVCWTEMESNIPVYADYNVIASGDITRGAPTFEKLFYGEDDLREYLRNDCEIDPAYVVEVPGEDGAPVEKNFLEQQVDYWFAFRENKSVAALIENIKAKADEEGKSPEEVFNEQTRWVLAARPGALRVGNMADNLQTKGKDYDSVTQYYNNNRTHTANNYYLPAVSPESGMGDSVIVDNYLGNNGRLAVGNQEFMVTKTLTPPTGFELNDDQKNREFNYQLYINNTIGERTATRVVYNPYSKSWQKRIASIDVLTDNSNLILDKSNQRAMFELGTVLDDPDNEGNEAYSARQVVTGSDGKLYYAKEDGTADENENNECKTQNISDLFNLYLPPNGDSSDPDAAGQTARRIYEYTVENGITDLANSGLTTFYPKGEGTNTPSDPGNRNSLREETEDRPKGTRTYWVLDAELIPISEIDEVEKKADNLSSEGTGPEVSLETGDDGTDSVEGQWQHGVGTTDDHKHMRHFTVMIRKPGEADNVNDEFISAFSTRTEFLTETLIFGENANQKDKDGKDADGTVRSSLTGNNLYDQGTEIQTHNKKDQVGTTEDIAKNTVEFTLKDGEGLLFNGLLSDSIYRITEKLTKADLDYGCTINEVEHHEYEDQNNTDQKFHTHKVESEDTEIFSVSGDVAVGFMEQARYVNSFLPPATASLLVHKHLIPLREQGEKETDSNAKYPAGYFFELTPHLDNPSSDPVKGPITLESGENGYTDDFFKDLPFTTGTYLYDVKEVPGKDAGADDETQPGILYDDTVYTVEVRVEAVKNGEKTEMRAQVTVKSPAGKTRFDAHKDQTETAANALKFTNERGMIASIFIDGHKDLIGGTLKDGQFTFTLKAESASDADHNVESGSNAVPMPGGRGKFGGTREVKNSGTGDFRFGAISYEKAGVYSYTLYERATGTNGCHYDTTKYRIIVNVTEVEAEDGEPALKAEKKIYRIDSDGSLTEISEPKPSFVNVISTPRKEEISPGNKELVKPGDLITYRIHYVNYKQDAATVKVLDILDKDVEFVSAVPEAALYLGSPESDSNAYRDLFAGSGSETSADAYRKGLQYEGLGVVYWEIPDVPGAVQAAKDGPEKDGPRKGLYPNEGYVELTVRVKQTAMDATDDEKQKHHEQDNVGRVYNEAAVKVANDPYVATKEVENPTPDEPTSTTTHLQIKKTVVNGNEYDRQMGFTFTIRLKNKDGEELVREYPYNGSSDGTIRSGGTLTLKHLGQIEIHDLPVGTQYEITEADYSGFTPLVSNGSGTVEADKVVLVEFKNYKTTRGDPEEPGPGGPSGNPRKYPPDDEPGPGNPSSGDPNDSNGPDTPRDTFSDPSDGPDTPTDHVTPRTGDTSDPVLWLSLLGFSLLGIMTVIRMFRKIGAKEKPKSE